MDITQKSGRNKTIWTHNSKQDHTRTRHQTTSLNTLQNHINILYQTIKHSHLIHTTNIQ